MSARTWQAANNGNGKRRWFVMRGPQTCPEYHDRADGRLARFASFEAAQARADRLNRESTS